MSDFGKTNFSISFNPTFAFPLDARTYFTDLASAEAAAATAEEVGSTNTVYYYGMRLVVADGENVTWYTIQPDKTLRQDGKSAYQYAVEGGFEGTEEEFAEKLAAIGSDSSGESGSGDENPDGDDNVTVRPGGNVSGSVISKNVLYSEQTLTDEEKAQARTNIGAVSEADVTERLNKFFVIGTEEPSDGPGLWFDTVNPPEDFPVILQVGDINNDDGVVVVNVIE